MPGAEKAMQRETGIRASGSEDELNRTEPQAIPGPTEGENGAEPRDSSVDAAPVEHVLQICPTCGNRLRGHRCKLVCTGCGYYMSCADYY